MNQPLIAIDNLSKVFDPLVPPALDKITLDIPKGHIIGIAGPDGSGKTTLIRLMAGLLKPTTGSVVLSGHEVNSNSFETSRLIGYMPQKFGLYGDLTVQQNLNLYADLKGVLGNEKRSVFERLLKFTGLQPFTNRLAKDLSGGMKQKLGLACALLHKPAVLLLDEPSVGVDPISRRELWNMVKELLNEEVSIVWSTAYLDEAERTDAVLLLNEGKMLYYGPSHDFATRVTGRTFLIDGIVGNKRKVLENALCDEEVIDGTIQGSRIRLVFKDTPGKPPIRFGGEASPIAPRFEDAFIDILGGAAKGKSKLAENMKAKENVDKAAIEAQQLTKHFGSFTAVNHVDFKVHSGEIFGLLGPNGAGKSTIFKMLCGLLPPSEGKAFVNGIDLQKAPSEARAQIGYMAQIFSLYGGLSVRQNLAFFAGIYNLQSTEKARKIDEMIEIFNLSSYLDVNAESLPLGFKQRLALACAVMHSPRVLFLDEPTSGVDPVVRREFWNHINGLVEKGVTVMVTTHFMDEAEYCDRIALIYRSQMIQLGSPDALKALAKTENNPSPTLEDAFIKLIEEYDHNGQ